MRPGLIPSALAGTLAALGGAVMLALLMGGAGTGLLTGVAAAAAAALLVAMVGDYWFTYRAWRAAAPTLSRRLPHAFSVGVRSPVHLQLTAQVTRPWRLMLHDHPASTLRCDALPMPVVLMPGRATQCSYLGTATQRGELRFEPAQLRVTSLLRLCQLNVRLGEREVRRVFPDFAQIMRYAWLASDRRLAELGIKTWQQRGSGTDFKQLTDYRPGDELRRIDWKATLRIGHPIVREYQDERDQCVLLLLDCGRRMRAEERSGPGAHFDAVLGAAALLAHVALLSGDAVGAQTFAVPAGSERFLAPAKGASTLGALIAGLYDQQPTLSHPDYLQAATLIMQRLRRRALIVILTNFRDEDGGELHSALELLRSRHVVMVASVREPALREIAEQPLADADAALEVAGAHLFARARAQAFARLSSRDALMVDAEPRHLAVELVNRYRAAKRAGVI